MDTGTKISGVAHLGLIGAALFGGVLRDAPPPVNVRDVSVVTSAQFAALMAAQQPPLTAPAPAALAAPDTTPDTPEAPAIAAAPEIDQQSPDTAAAPDTETAPDALPEPLPPQPEAPLVDATPQPAMPDAEVALLATPGSISPEQRPAPRVAPQPVAPPPPDVIPDEVTRPDVAPDRGAETPQPRQDATAPEAASDRIVTEANEGTELAPRASIRPPSRRPRPPATRAATPTPRTPEVPNTDAAVQAALAEALGAPAPAAPTGPPLTSGEKNDLIFSVSKCWNVGSLSSAALATTVVVAVTMTEDGKPVVSSIRLIGSSGGSDASASQAFAAARRAIIRCGGKGYGLPVEKYGQWRDIEMTFNPERMRIR